MPARAASLCLAALALAPAASAQIGRGIIQGTVSDASGSIVVGADVRATHQQTQVEHRATTNEAGLYIFAGIPVGPYQVSASASGFKQNVRRGVTLLVDDRLRVDFRLDIGMPSESIVVTAAPPLVDSAGATVGKVIENKRLSSLPVSGLSALALVALTPNVRSHARNAAGFGERGDLAGTFSVNGGPPGFNNVVIDGSNNLDPRGGILNTNPPVDTIEEFKVQSGTMSAEYGFTAGGVVNMVTKSGTNEFHGSLYEFLRNDKLDARNAFSATKPALRYNQFGGTAGGPVLIPKVYNGRNRSFFFFNYEEWRLPASRAIVSTVPVEAQRRGDFSQLRDVRGNAIQLYDPRSTAPNPAGSGFVRTPFAGNILPAARLDRSAQRILEFYPLPNRQPSDAFTNSNNFAANNSGTQSARRMTMKGDQRFSDRNSFMFRYILWNHKNDQAANADPFRDRLSRVRNDDYLNRNFSLTDTHVFTPTLLNEFRVGVTRLVFPFSGLAAGENFPDQLGMHPSIPRDTMPRMNIQGYPSWPSSLATLKGFITNHSVQLLNNVTKTLGKHTLKAGLDLRQNQYNLLQCNRCSGEFSFNNVLTGNPLQPAGTGDGLASFLLGAVATGSVESAQGITYQSISHSYYFQDDWKALPRLTLNLGFRYDYQQVPGERFNRLSNFNPFAANPRNNLPGRLEFAGQEYGRTAVGADFNDFSPRFGFALDLTGNGRMAIRGGYGIFYPYTFRGDYFESITGFGTTLTTYAAPGGNTQFPAFYLPDGLPSAPVQPLGRQLGPSAFESQNVTFYQPSGRTSYSQQWTLTIQRQLPGGFLLETGYTGNKGTKLITREYDLNQLDPRYYSLGRRLQDRVPNPFAGRVQGAFGGPTLTLEQSLRPFPYYNAINVTSPRQGSSIYHGWLVNLERRLSGGFVLLASYSFGKLINENIRVPSPGGSEQLNAGANYRLGPYNRRLERGLDSTDSGGRFVVSTVYELPFGPGKRFLNSSGALGRITGGWQVNAIGTLQQGLPLVIRGASNFLADRPDSTGTSAVLESPARERWFNTAQFVNPPEYTIGNTPRTLPDVRSPGIKNLDFSLFKTTRIAERFHLQFRAEAFNITNRVNLFSPNGNFVPGPDGRNRSGTFGTITESRDARTVQFGLKLLF